VVIFSSRPPPTILVIYADGDGAAYVQYLATAGFRAASASRIPSGEIVDRTLATMPDLIVLDYDCDGETIERLKADRRTAAIPVIALADLLVLPGRSGSSDSALLGADRLSIDRQ
jgi:DNA-binding response OmpR family regulator